MFSRFRLSEILGVMPILYIILKIKRKEKVYETKTCDDAGSDKPGNQYVYSQLCSRRGYKGSGAGQGGRKFRWDTALLYLYF